MYVIQTDDNHRIVAYENSDNPIVNDPERDFLFAELPEGITEANIFDYLYVNGTWVYDPRPPAPSTDRIVMIGKTALRFPG